MLRVLAGRRIRGEIATNPGTWGNNIFVDVDYDTGDPTNTFNLVVTETITENGRPRIVSTETFRNLTLDPDSPSNAIATVNETSRLVQLDRRTLPGTGGLGALAAPFPRPAATGSLGNELPIPPQIPANDATFSVVVNGDVDPAVARPARTATLVYGGPAPTTYQALRPFVESAIRALASDPAITADTERALLAGATVKLLGTGSAAAPYRILVLGGRGGTGYQADATLDVIGPALPADLGFPAAITPNRQQYRLSGGVDGTVPVGAAALTGNLVAKTGIYALQDVDLVNILCLPLAADLSATDMRSVYDAANTYITGRRGFLLVDIPEATASLEAMQTWLAQNDSLRSKNAAVYFPRTFVPDPVNSNRLKSIAASGTIAGLYARTDATRGVWKAPAGTEANLQNVQALAYTLTDLQNGALNPLGVNCLRTFPIYGNICWGARTLDGADQLASEWKYIPIRRLALFIEEIAVPRHEVGRVRAQ